MTDLRSTFQPICFTFWGLKLELKWRYRDTSMTSSTLNLARASHSTAQIQIWENGLWSWTPQRRVTASKELLAFDLGLTNEENLPKSIWDTARLKRRRKTRLPADGSRGKWKTKKKIKEKNKLPQIAQNTWSYPKMNTRTFIEKA